MVPVSGGKARMVPVRKSPRDATTEPNGLIGSEVGRGGSAVSRGKTQEAKPVVQRG